MKPSASLFAKILSWFFLNMVLVAAVLVFFFIFQQRINPQLLLGRQGADRIKAAGMLIVHDLGEQPQSNWSAVLGRHADIHQVDFMLVLGNGKRFASTNIDLPLPVDVKVREMLRPKPPKGNFPPEFEDTPPRQAPGHPPGGVHRGTQRGQDITRQRPTPFKLFVGKPFFMKRTGSPTRYWYGSPIHMPHRPQSPPMDAILLAVSESFHGSGFFFNPLPWIVVAGAVILISVLFWIPMVRNITRPLARMTGFTEKIADGNFNVSIDEPRSDEIGRLAKAINHMTARLAALVQGQKRFLGDVAHELGSPLARIQFGLGALEQRVDVESKDRVRDVMQDVDHLSRLVSELLAFSRADIKSSTVKLEKIDLLPVVETAVKRETTPATIIEVNVDPGIRVVASEELLLRALANLLRNAVRYANDAGKISITAARKGDRVEIEVKDMGPGVPDDLLDQLFEPFFRPETSRDRDTGGVGLGLAIVKTCVETCKGSVSAANHSPHGFAVTIVLRA